MSKRKRPVRRVARGRRQTTNWPVIIGGVTLGAVALFALLYLALREPEVRTLTAYCQANPERCVAEGEAGAPVTIVEVSDYGCSHCRDFNLEKAEVIAQQYVAAGIVEWVILPFALRDETAQAAESSLCARDQGAFNAYHRALFELQTTSLAFTRDGYLAAAQTAGVEDLERFTGCVDSREHRETVNANRLIARQNGVNGTPTFFINDRALGGNVPLSTFDQRINSALQGS